MNQRSSSTVIQPQATSPVIPQDLLEDLQQMIGQTQKFLASTVNASLTMLYWRVGKRIRKEILRGERGEYGQKIIVSVSRQLTLDYGSGFSEKNLRRMIQFSETFTDEQIVVSLVRQLSWTHFIALIPLKDNIKRDFYSEMCRVERWSVRTLRSKINSMLYERTALSKRPESVREPKWIDCVRRTGSPRTLCFGILMFWNS